MDIVAKSDRFAINLRVETKITQKQYDKLDAGVDLWLAAFSSDSFKRFCENHVYRNNIGFWYTNDTGLDVYNKLMSGFEVLSPELDNEADVWLRINNKNKRGVLGYTYPNTRTQWMYSWVLSSSFRTIAGNLAHELCHKAGYKHEYRYTKNRQYSVPYAVGYFVRDFGK